MCNTKWLAFHLSVSTIQLRHTGCRPTFVSLTAGRGQYLRSERRCVATGPLHWASPVLATFLVIKPTNTEVTINNFTYYLRIQQAPRRDSFFQLRTLPTQLFINLMTPNVNYSGRTAPLTSKVAFYIFIQQI